jgi:AraC-like DNA-binding protein
MFNKKSDNRWLFDKNSLFLQQIIPTMKQKIHPIIQNATLIEEQGIAVLENVTRMPAYGEPIVSPHFIVSLNHRGWVRVQYDFKTIDFREHEFAIVYPNHVVNALESSDDYLATLLVISPQFLALLREMYPNHLRFEYHFNSSFRLNDQQYEGINSCLHQLSVISRLDHPDRRELLVSQVDIMAHLTEIYMKQNGSLVIKETNSVQQLLLRFHATIAEHFCENHEVKFYADKLCLSPKHFGTVVRQATGIGASEWIARYVIIHAKHLLNHHPDFTIQQISDSLGFSEQASFARYFKRQTGLTPTEYREKG